MNYEVTQDENGTHLSWELQKVEPGMIDWFWSNMEKGFLLWHPEEHEPLEWAIPPKHGDIMGAVHIAPQTWSDGKRQNLYIRFENLNEVPEVVRSYIKYQHCIIVAGLGFGEESLSIDEPMGYRLHQWEATAGGVKGMSNAFGWKKPENHDDGMIWAKHAATEVGNWEVFLPQLYQLYKVVSNTKYNPFMSLEVDRIGSRLRYKNEVS